MADIPTPPHPKTAAKGLAGKLKGHPKWVYIAGFAVLAGMAYLAWSRGHSGAADGPEDGADTDPNLEGDPSAPYYDTDGSSAAGALGGGYVTAAPTQGAFGGYDAPDPADPLPAAMGAEDGAGTTINVYGSGAAGFEGDSIPEEPTEAVTGGGMPHRSAKAHAKPHHKKKAAHHKPAHHAHRKPKRKLPRRKPQHHKAHGTPTKPHKKKVLPRPKKKAPAHHAHQAPAHHAPAHHAPAHHSPPHHKKHHH